MAPTGRRLPVKLTASAEIDLDVAFAYVNERNRAAAHDLHGRLQAAVSRLGEFPEMGSPLPADDFAFVPPGTRIVAVEPYLIFYRVTAQAVIVTRVLHSRQDSLGALFE